MPLHIVQRGHNREPCFFCEEDYLAYLHWLGEVLKKEGCALHAFALMTNHVHLLLTPERAESVPRLVIALGRRYVQYINTTYLALAVDGKARQAAYPQLFRAHLDQKAIDDIRLALNQNQPLGSPRFYANIETVIGERRQPKPRGRPRACPEGASALDAGQGNLLL